MQAAKYSLFCALTAALIAAQPAMASDKDRCSLQNGSVSVTGIGEITAAPDQAVLNFQIRASAPTAAEARTQAENTVTAFLKALEPLKLPKGAIAADNLTVQARYAYNEGKSTLTGFEGLRSVSVTVDDFSLIGEVTDLAFKSGINEAVGFTYQLKDPKAAQQQARSAAIADAKAKAEELAEGFDVKLGKPCQLSYGYSAVPSPRPLMLMAARADTAGSRNASYAADDLTVKAEVSAVFTLK